MLSHLPFPGLLILAFIEWKILMFFDFRYCISHGSLDNLVVDVVITVYVYRILVTPSRFRLYMSSIF